MDKQIDAIVIGAGPAGISAAITLRKYNKNVILLERGAYPGCKNMYGGAVYKKALEEVFNIEKLPYERVINSHSWSFLNETGSFDITYNNDIGHSFAIKRFDLENWMVNEAKKQGVYYIPSTVVKNLIIENNQVKGIETELEKFYAPIVIIADGVNSLLAKQIGLRKKYEAKNMILTVKEAFKLDKKTIEERFNLEDNNLQGANKLYFGSDFGKLKPYDNLFMMAFLFSFKDTIMLGVGCNLEDLRKNKLNINFILEEVKKHPSIKKYIKGSKPLEYSAHLIPEGGYKHLANLTTNGAMIIGDAAGFVNSVHIEGTNFAIISGKLAAQSAVEALDKKDFSKKQLNSYIKKLKNSFILKDLYSYRNVMEELQKRTNSISKYYPNKIKEFFEIVTSANCTSKSKQFRGFIKKFLTDRNILELLKDIFSGLKCAINVFFGK